MMRLGDDPLLQTLTRLDRLQRQATRRTRHFLRLARLFYPAIRVGRTRLEIQHADEPFSRVPLLLPLGPPWLFDAAAALPLVDVEMRSHSWAGRHRIAWMVVGYDGGTDVCVVRTETVRVAVLRVPAMRRRP